MKKKLVIYGAGGLGREVRSMLYAFPDWQLAGFYDDGKLKGHLIGDIPVLGGMSELSSIREKTHVIIAIGNPGIKRNLAERLLKNTMIDFPTLIHPGALLQDRSSIQVGKGTIVTAGTILTTEVHIGEHVLINLNCTLGHDVVIGHYTSIMPGANIAGEVTIGHGVLIGSGSTILNGLQVGHQSVVGAGAVVTKDVPEHSTVVGVPAGPLKAAT